MENRSSAAEIVKTAAVIATEVVLMRSEITSGAFGALVYIEN